MRRAASLILCQLPSRTSHLKWNDNGCFRVLLVKRAAKGPFPNLYAFPGGAVHESLDLECVQSLQKLNQVHAEHLNHHCKWHTTLVTKDSFESELLLKVTAARELLEECGVLLSSQGVRTLSREERQEIQSSSNKFLDLFKKCQELTLSDLKSWSHWITPPHEQKRFDTRFFLKTVEQEENFEIQIDQREIVDYTWLQPRDAIIKHHSNEISLYPPQYYLLSELSFIPPSTLTSESTFESREIMHIAPELKFIPNTKNEVNRNISSFNDKSHSEHTNHRDSLRALVLPGDQLHSQSEFHSSCSKLIPKTGLSRGIHRVIMKPNINLVKFSILKGHGKFKSRKMASKRRNLRKKPLDSSEDEQDHHDAQTDHKDTINNDEKKLDLKEALELRKMKRKRPGIDAQLLMKAEKLKQDDEEENSDPWKLLSGGGLLTADQINKKKKKVTGNFETESNVMDTEKLMHKFIEQELKKKLGENGENQLELQHLLQKNSGEIKDGNADDDDQKQNKEPIETKSFLEKLKEDLFANSAIKREESVKEDVRYLSTTAEMLIAVPEVDLGIDAKIKNIERTEKLKEKSESSGSTKDSSLPSFDKHGYVSTRFDLSFERRMKAMEHTSTDKMVFDRFKKRALNRRR